MTNGDDMENEGGPISPAEQHLLNLAAAFETETGKIADETEITEQNLGLPVYIQLSRCYDALLLLLNHFDEDAADKMVAIHQQGEFVGPDPALAPATDSEQEVT
jgi:hypothetical protein